MQTEQDETTDTNETEAKPTITIAEREGTAARTAKPTITIAEKEGTTQEESDNN